MHLSIFQLENFSQIITLVIVTVVIAIIVVILRIIAFFMERAAKKKRKKEKKLRDEFKGLPPPEKTFEKATLAKQELPAFDLAAVSEMKDAAPPDTVFCTECGWRGEPDDEFCGSCGARLFKGA